MTVRPIASMGRPLGSGGRRKAITGWSAASRRRLRQVLISHYPPEGWAVYGACFTIPGEVPTFEEARAMWAAWRLQAVKEGVAAIWRMEVQQRGAMHWHVVIACEHPDQMLCLKQAWYAISGYRMELPGAARHAVHVEPDVWQEGKAWRYLCDHTSKRKQAQIAKGVGVGRAWGVIGKDVWRVWRGGRHVVSEKAFFRFLRAIRRLRAPLVRDGGPWGRHVGRKSRGGRAGRRVWFQEGDSPERLLRWAQEISASSDD